MEGIILKPLLHTTLSFNNHTCVCFLLGILRKRSLPHRLWQFIIGSFAMMLWFAMAWQMHVKKSWASSKEGLFCMISSCVTGLIQGEDRLRLRYACTDACKKNLKQNTGAYILKHIPKQIYTILCFQNVAFPNGRNYSRLQVNNNFVDGLDTV